MTVMMMVLTVALETGICWILGVLLTRMSMLVVLVVIEMVAKGAVVVALDVTFLAGSDLGLQ